MIPWQSLISLYFIGEYTVDMKSPNTQNVYIVGGNISTSVHVECCQTSPS